jgi:hypothetical protein
VEGWGLVREGERAGLGVTVGGLFRGVGFYGRFGGLLMLFMPYGDFDAVIYGDFPTVLP